MGDWIETFLKDNGIYTEENHQRIAKEIETAWKSGQLYERGRITKLLEDDEKAHWEAAHHPL